MNYFVSIVGCQYNEWDGARLNFFMQKLGFSESKPVDADVIIVLACSVRKTAVDRVLGRIRNWQAGDISQLPRLKFDGDTAKGRKNNPLIVVTGCVLEKDRVKFEKRDVEIFESGDLRHLFEILSTHFKTKFDHFSVGDFRTVLIEQNIQSKYIPIMIGCDNFCSYCAVPYTRGRERSRPIADILEETKELISKGHKEIILLGQNVNSYKINSSDLRLKHAKNKKDFTILLEKLNDLPGDFVISFTSNHPKDMSDDIIEAVITLPKIKKSIHLPLQSGSDKILQAMNRPYTSEQYLKIIEKISAAGAKYHTAIEISTDVIVGFPGEEEEDFQKTLKLLKKINYPATYINKYSPRSGTAAEKLGDPISWDEKMRRWNILNDIVYKR